MKTERYDIIEGPGRPSICLGMARGDWFTTCCTAKDFSLDITGQTRDIFDVFDRHMAEAGTDISKVLFVQFWLKHMSDYDAVNAVWADWIDAENPPARSCVRADMANPNALIEIRIYAARD